MLERGEKPRIIIDAKGNEREITVRPIEELPPLKEQDNKRFERHLFIPDLQIPDQNKKAVEALFKFIPDYKPDRVHILGDLVNFTRVGKYEVLGEFGVTINDEKDEAVKFLKRLTHTVRDYKPNAEIDYYEGNHEQRIKKYLARNADALTDLRTDSGDYVLSVQNLFGLRELGINWVEYFQSGDVGGVRVEHGDVTRAKSGYTGQAMIEKRGRSGVSVHTHRLAFITKNQGGDVKYWIEAGSLCNLEPTPTYTKQPDWVNGFAIGIFDKKEKILHPQTILFQKDQFYFEGKVYK